MLGTRLDAGLSFDAHVRACATRGAQAIGGLRVLARANTGVRPVAARHLVRACVYPHMLWMAGVWWKGRGNGGSALILNAAQRSCARLVTGGYGPSGLDALQVEASLMPVELLLNGALFSIGLCALSAALTYPLWAQSHLFIKHVFQFAVSQLLAECQGCRRVGKVYLTVLDALSVGQKLHQWCEMIWASMSALLWLLGSW
ncbi:hypothetical protein DMC30DRAFT_176645 [Rhodotorula diobovata]|uniref:Uncharacterized protein n=1 Tax=Rhodotorula diobovata TaxID=5288 RepID=A0A5C5FKJ0_9BASI|nr:hypothetical protein DMC30DRAFT_176645 [Rhodotorula diobovata]